MSKNSEQVEARVSDVSSSTIAATQQPKKTKAGGVRQTNQQRVLEMSAELFNRYGIEAVSVSQIAEALKISPGNLTYHYKKKADLLADHISAFEERLRDAIEQLPVLADARTFSDAYMDLLQLTMHFRFLFIGANYIIQNDLVPIARYEKLIEVVKRAHVRQIKRLVAEGYMKPIEKPYSMEALIDGIWWQWLGWLIAMQITPAAKRAPERKLLADAVLHIFFISHHYVDPDFFREVQMELKKIGREASSRPE
ncbi:MAG: TetR/AcrR family transcriptional regulator [Steroidobacteraceae bacterium]